MSAAGQTQPRNDDKITLAIIGAMLNDLKVTYKEGHKDVVDSIERMRCDVKDLEIEIGKHTRDIENIQKDIRENIKPALKENHDNIDSVRIKSNWWDGANSIVALIAAALGITSR